MKVKTFAELQSEGVTPELLFWVGCAGSFDSRSQKISKKLVEILDEAAIPFAILGNEEMCTGDPARRAGNEFVFQMLALQNIQTLNGYGVQKIVTTCPHCFNTLKNEYPELGGHYEVIHHSQLLKKLLEEGRIKVRGDVFKGKKITYHDSCYLGRANNIYEAPRDVLEHLDNEIVEMQRSRNCGLCCGAGGAQMFKEDEPGDKRINAERADEALGTGAEIVAVNCPFCLTMLGDGLKEKDEKVMVFDISELILQDKT
ncbi:(Fe-S)-binding protein [Membranihabitans maritimus]|uniref:(Fe-S)-binding protein n=1 Tax=Membranihabitans maritimus TaxID=2904244 RepID=UPI001F29A2A6|nr:(Fe-S)-binding protein [Membranihabitans maritimus]